MAIEELALVGAIFVLAGFVKGVTGLGLPTVSLALLTVGFGLKAALVLMLMPSFATNLWQAVTGGELRPLLRRLWPLLAAAVLATWLGVAMLARSDAAWLPALLGVVLVVYAGLGLSGLRPPAPGGREVWNSPLVGAVNGILTGLTGSFVVPGVLYLSLLGLGRDVLIQAMGILFTVSTLALAIALGGERLLPVDGGLVSLAAVLPAVLGMHLGRRLRRGLSEARFRQVFFASLLLLGLYIAWTALA